MTSATPRRSFRSRRNGRSHEGQTPPLVPTMSTEPAWIATLRTIVDPTQIETAPERLTQYAVDGQPPAAVVFPQTFEQVAALLQWAQRERVAVCPRGSGTKTTFGNLPSRVDLVLSTSRLNRISEYDAANFTLTGEAGVTIAQVMRQTASSQQMLPLHYPWSPATLGGIIATNAYTPKRLAYGGVRDLLLGLRVALPSGEIVHFGGKVVKNVAGYDMSKLFLGSLGAFGVILEATFKLYALPEREAALLATLPSLWQGGDAAAHLLRTQLLPSQVLLLNPAAAGQVMGPTPAQISPDGGALLVSFEGMEEAVDRQLTELSQLCRGYGAQDVQVLSGESYLRLQERLDHAMHGRVSEALLTSPHASLSSPLVLRLGTLPSHVHTVMETVAQLLSFMAQPVMVIGDCGIGVVRICTQWPATEPGDRLERLAHAIAELSSLVAGEGGYAVVEATPAELKATLDVWGSFPGTPSLLKALKAKFDPGEILNSARFIGGL